MNYEKGAAYKKKERLINILGQCNSFDMQVEGQGNHQQESRGELRR